MARPLRLEFAGALYHVTSRGDRREDIYETCVDRVAFLELLGEVCQRYSWVCHPYCLMDNHYHLLIETSDANLYMAQELSDHINAQLKRVKDANGKKRKFDLSERFLDDSLYRFAQGLCDQPIPGCALGDFPNPHKRTPELMVV